MKFIVIVISLVILITGFGIVNSKKTVNSKETIQPSEPLQVVEQYCDLSAKGDYEKIKNYTSATPKEYFNAQSYSYQKSNNSTNSENSSNKTYLDAVDSDELDPYFLTYINEKIPKLLNEYDVFIREVKNVSIKGNEARVEVELRSRLYETYRAQYHFLLYRINNEWKVFMIEYPLEGVSKYGISNQ